MKRRAPALAAGGATSLLGAALYVRAVLLDAQPMSLLTVLVVVGLTVAATLLFVAGALASRRTP